jgi:membrane associated rhomboid family serine protease
MPPTTAFLIAANLAAYLYSGLAPSVLGPFALWPLGAGAAYPGTGFAPWQLLTYAFLHGGFAHLAFNMFGLYMFGSPLERVLGAGRFLVYYFACVVTAALTQLLVLAVSGEYIPTIGASGGVFGLLLGFAVLFPRQRIMLLIPPIPMSARTFAIVYAVIELALGVAGSSSVAHFAHLGGMVGGFFLLRHWNLRAVG